MGKRLYFQERLVYEDEYPEVFWPQHPLARPNGRVRVHCVVVYERDGVIPEGSHIHHKDENRWNWSPENLEVLTNAEHQHQHRGYRATVPCEICTKPFPQMGGMKFCSARCSAVAQERIVWPSKDELLALLAKHSYCAVGRLLGVSDNAVRKRLRRI